MAKICIDAGHGGSDPGTGGLVNEVWYYEKNINLAVAKKLKTALVNKGHTVVMTRETDVFVPVNNIPVISNNNNCDVFISIHCNGHESNASGTETFIEQGGSLSSTDAKLAGLVNNAMVAVLKTPNRGVKNDRVLFIRNVNAYNCLAELAFMTNQSDLKKLITTSLQTDVANSIANAIQSFINQYL